MPWNHLWALILVPVMLAACTPEAPGSPAEQTLATSVAGTLEALPTPEPTNGPIATAAAPTQTSAAKLPPHPATRQLAFTDQGDLWLLEDRQEPRRLTQIGHIVSVQFSLDGQSLLYERQDDQSDLYELRYIQADSHGDRLLLHHGILDALYPLDDALHILPDQIEFTPDSSGILFNTRLVFEGPGLVKNDDLLHLDLASGAITPILPRGAGGDFTRSPDGSMLAISRPMELHAVWADGRPLAFTPVSFPAVMTYSEYAYYPPVVWSPDSSRFGSLVPSVDPFAPDAGGQVWIIRVPEGEIESYNFVEGQTFFPQSRRRSLLSPSLNHIAYFRETDEANIVDLVIAAPDGSDPQPYATGQLRWLGWHPSGDGFAYSETGGPIYFGQLQQDAVNLGEGIRLLWAGERDYLLLAGRRGEWRLAEGEIGGEVRTLLNLSTQDIALDLWPKAGK